MKKLTVAKGKISVQSHLKNQISVRVGLINCEPWRFFCCCYAPRALAYLLLSHYMQIYSVLCNSVTAKDWCWLK